MAWWSTVSAADLIAVVVPSDHYSRAEFAFRQADRKIARGDIRPFRYADVQIKIHLVSGEQFVHPCRVHGEAILPLDLPQALAQETWPPVEVVDAATGKRSSASTLPGAFWLPAAARRELTRLREPWGSMFPGMATAEFYVLRDRLRQIFEQAPGDPDGAIREATTMVRESTVAIACLTQLPVWELRAAECEEDVLDDASRLFEIEAPTWTELRADPSFTEALAGRPLSVLSAHGWRGLIAVQLLVLLAGRGICAWEGCLKPRAGTKFCTTHADENRRAANAKRQRRHRARRRQA